MLILLEIFLNFYAEFLLKKWFTLNLKNTLFGKKLKKNKEPSVGIVVYAKCIRLIDSSLYIKMEKLEMK